MKGKVDQGSQKATASGEALTRILEQIDGVTLQINQVARAAQEQTKATPGNQSEHAPDYRCRCPHHCRRPRKPREPPINFRRWPVS